MTKVHNPNGVPLTYSDGIEVSSGKRTLYIAGQIGVAADKSIPAGIVEQTRLTFGNLESVLRSANMGLEHIVKMTVFLTDPSDFPAFSETRISIMSQNKPASTLVYIKQLIWPQLLIEIDAIAVAP